MNRVITIPRNADGSVRVLDPHPLLLESVPDIEKPFPFVQVLVGIEDKGFAIHVPVSDSMRDDNDLLVTHLTAYAQQFQFDLNKAP